MCPGQAQKLPPQHRNETQVSGGKITFIKDLIFFYCFHVITTQEFDDLSPRRSVSPRDNLKKSNKHKKSSSFHSTELTLFTGDNSSRVFSPTRPSWGDLNKEQLTWAVETYTASTKVEKLVKASDILSYEQAQSFLSMLPPFYQAGKKRMKRIYNSLKDGFNLSTL